MITELGRPVIGLLVGLVAGHLVTTLAQNRGTARPAAAAGPTRGGLVLTNFRSLLALEASQVREFGLARLNLLCAQGLPGEPETGLETMERTLDQWAGQVAAETERNLPKFRANPGEFNRSEGYFRALALVTVLQQDCGVGYNPARIGAPDFADARDLFLPGLLTGRHQGTCVSLPVLYVAVGRRLGYPLKLVAAKGHLFARWESADGRERFNLETTNQGLNTFPDEYYHTWPARLSQAELAGAQYLRSLTPAEELAVFLSTRGHCLKALGRSAEALVCYAHARALAPQAELYLAYVAAVVSRDLPDWQRVRVDLGEKAEDEAQRAERGGRAPEHGGRKSEFSNLESGIQETRSGVGRPQSSADQGSGANAEGGREGPR